MAERTLDLGRKIRRVLPRRAAALRLIWPALCVSLMSQPASGEPRPEKPAEWKAGIERPSPRWDYDGKRILGHIGHDICLWDATTGKLLHRMKGHKESIISVQFSPDAHHALSSSWIGPGPMMPIVSRDTRTILWNLGTGRERDSFDAQVAGEFSPDGKLILAFSKGPDKIMATWGKAQSMGEVRALGTPGKFDNAAVWETYTGRQLVKAKLDEDIDPGRDMLHFSPDGRHFVRLGTSNAVLYSTADGRETGKIDVRTWLNKPSARRYASGGAFAFVNLEEFRLTDIESGRVIHKVPHGLGLRDVKGFAWAHDGSRVAALRPSEAIRIWDIASGTAKSGADSVPGSFPTVVVSPDNRRLAILGSWSEGREMALGIYDMNTGKEVVRIKFDHVVADIIGFSPDSKTLLMRGSEFVIYNAENGETIRTLKLLDDPERILRSE